MRPIFSTLLIVGFLSCNNYDNSSKLSNRDSLIGRFLKITDNLQWTDTLDQSRKILKAFHQNDTSYLRKAIEEVQEIMKYREEILRNPSCSQLSGIDSYNFKEAYQFEYGAAFCDEAVNLIVGERNDSIILLGYHYKLVYNTDSCLSSVKIERILTGKQWNTIKQSLYRADFWGLNPRNYNSGFDGSGLTVTGYQRPVNAFQGRYSKVYRWAAEEMAVGQIFKTVLEMSGVKAPCFHYY